MSLNDRYAEARDVAAQVSDACLQLQESGTAMTTEAKLEASTKLNQLSSMVASMERDYEAAKANHGARWKHRLQQLRENERRLRESMSGLMHSSHRTTARAQERERLFEGAAAGPGGASMTAVMEMDKEGEHLRSAVGMMGEIASTTDAISASLGRQNDSVRGMMTRLSEMLSTIDVIGSLTRLIQARTQGDRTLLWVGLVGILVLMLLVYRWTHGGLMGAGLWASSPPSSGMPDEDMVPPWKTTN